MFLSQFQENINTECRIPVPTLQIKALKLDSQTNSLKQKVGCRHLKSCDYFKRKKNNLYFIEISDFNAQFEQLSTILMTDESKKYIKMEIRLKLSDTLLIYQKLLEKFLIDERNIKLKKKALLTICKDNISDSIILSQITRELERHYCPTHLSSIKLIPYTALNTIFTR